MSIEEKVCPFSVKGMGCKIPNSTCDSERLTEYTKCSVFLANASSGEIPAEEQYEVCCTIYPEEAIWELRGRTRV